MPIYRGSGGAGTTEDVAVSAQTAADALTATTQATNAANSATSAATSASTATTQATNAAASAAAALASQTAAATSETNAANSASAAAASAASATSSDYAVSSWFTTTNNSANWDTAYGWGDHSVQNYLDTADIGVSVQAYDATILNNADIGVSVQAYDATIVVDADIANMLETTDIGTSVQAYDADTAKLDVAQTWTAAQRGATQTANATGATTLDFGTYQNFVLTLTGNVTLSNPTTESVGQSGFIVCIQDGTGGRTVSLGTDYETVGGTGIVLSTAASARDVVPYIVSATGSILLGAPQKGFA